MSCVEIKFHCSISISYSKQNFGNHHSQVKEDAEGNVKGKYSSKINRSCFKRGYASQSVIITEISNLECCCSRADMIHAINFTLYLSSGSYLRSLFPSVTNDAHIDYGICGKHTNKFYTCFLWYSLQGILITRKDIQVYYNSYFDVHCPHLYLITFKLLTLKLWLISDFCKLILLSWQPCQFANSYSPFHDTIIIHDIIESCQIQFIFPLHWEASRWKRHFSLLSTKRVSGFV